MLDEAIRLRSEKQFDAARELLQTLLEVRPDDATVNYHMAWLHDNLGLEAEAAPYYERALNGELADADRQGALLGLGSTYRCLGQFQKSVDIFRRTVDLYPENASFQVFLALALFELGEHDEAFSIVLHQLAATTSNKEIALYKRALLEFSSDLKMRFERQ